MFTTEFLAAKFRILMQLHMRSLYMITGAGSGAEFLLPELFLSSFPLPANDFYDKYVQSLQTTTVSCHLLYW